MTPEEQKYIDDKFKEMQDKLTNPDPQEAWDRSRKYLPLYYKYYAKWLVVALVCCVGTMLFMFYWLGIF